MQSILICNQHSIAIKLISETNAINTYLQSTLNYNQITICKKYNQYFVAIKTQKQSLLICNQYSIAIKLLAMISNNCIQSNSLLSVTIAINTYKQSNSIAIKASCRR